ncbi:MAG: TolC family protein [Desulforhopalus sp.]
MKLFNLLMPLVLAASTAHGVDLAEMQKMALENREVIQRYVTNMEQSEQDIIRARGGYYPSVDIGYTANSLNQSSFYEEQQNSVATGVVSWNIFAGFSDKYNVQSAELTKEVEEYRLQSIEQDVQLDVALAYLSVYERLANRDVAEAAYDTLKRLYRDGENRYEVGLIDKNELLKFRVDYDNADITLKAAEAGLKKSVNLLSRQVGSEIKFADLDFADFSELPPQIDKGEYTRKMLADRSEIKTLEKTVEVTIARVKADKGEYYPKVDVAGSYRKYDDNLIVGNGSLDDNEWRAQMVLSMNLFRGFTTEATVARAKLETRAVQYDLDELKNTLITDLDNLYIDFVVAYENVDVAKRAIEQAKENLRITQLKYDEGLQRQLDLLDAVSNLSRAQYNLVVVVRALFANSFSLTRMIDGF